MREPRHAVLTPTRPADGKKVSIFLEELKAAYPDFEYEVYAIDFSKNEQKEE